MKKILITTTGLSLLLMPIVFVSCSSKTNYYYAPLYSTNNSTFFTNRFIEKFEKKLKQIQDDNFYLINGIIFTDKNLDGDDAQFDYKSREIFVSSKNIKNKNWNDDVQAEYIFELVFHEYNHFLNSLYLNNIDDCDQQLDKTIFKGDYSRKVERWNRSFLTNFKRLLKYDQDTSLYYSNVIKEKYVSLGSIYNQKSLFDIANGSARPSYPLLKGNEVMAPLNYDKDIPIDDQHIIRSNSLGYLFSMQELVARKMQIINMKYSPFNSKGQGFNQDGWIFTKDENYVMSPYLQDIVNYQGAMNSNDLYLYDKPTKALSDLYNKYIDNQSNVRLITYKNGYKRIDDSFEGLIDKSQISFTGIYEKKVKVGYLENNNFIEIPSTWISYRGKYEYHTNYFNKDSIINKVLAFKDKNNIIKMTSVRTGEQGIVTTYDLNNSKNGNLKVVKENSYIVIKNI